MRLESLLRISICGSVVDNGKTSKLDGAQSPNPPELSLVHPMNASRVKINIALEEEIATLYDVGLHRAKKIVAYRESNGPFQHPEDLSKVEGISSRLATTLAAQIDWYVPLAPEEPKKRDWITAILFTSITFVLGLTTLIGVVAVFAPPGSIPFDTVFPIPLVRWLGVIALVCFTINAATHVGNALSTDRERGRWWSRFGLGVLAVGLVVLAPGLIWLAVHHSFESLVGGGSIDVRRAKLLLLASLVSLGFIYIIAAPQLILLLRPRFAESKWLSRGMDATFGVIGLIILLGIGANIEILPFWLLIPAGLAGFVVFLVTLDSIRRGEPLFQVSRHLIDLRILWQRKTDIDSWREWLSMHLPKPAEQRALKEALQEIHRPTKMEYALRIGFLFIGGWLVLKAVEAVIQVLIQEWWHSLFK